MHRLAVFLFLALFGAVVHAQSGDGAGDWFDLVGGLSNDEMLSAAGEAGERVEGEVARITALLQAAEEEGDPRLVRCVTDRLTAANGTARLVNSSAGALASAVADGERESAENHFVTVMAGADSVQRERLAAELCASGDALSHSGETERTSEMNDPFPGSDAQRLDLPAFDDGEEFIGVRVDEATPFQ